MTDAELKSCIGTIEMLRRLHGVMNVIDAGNCEKIIKVLSDIPKYKDAYGKGWVDGAKASYEHLKMCEEEQSGDVISRQVVKDKYRERLVNSLKDDDRGIDLSKYAEEPYKAFCEFMDSIPSVNPQEQKTGHWIENAPQYDMLNPQYICSECGNAHTRTTPYCEMCGAKMVESQESEVE